MKKFLTYFVSWICCFPVFAADVKVSELPSASTLTGSELIPVVQSSTTKQATGTQLSTYIRGTVTKSDVGLSNVDNTSDATKNSATATLTNKTLTAPVISSPTGLVKADVGLSNVDNTSDSTKNAASVTLTNKTISGSSNTLSNIGNSSLTNSSITLNGSSLSLGGTRTLTLAGSDFANQGTTTTVLHGNAAGNPSFGAVSLTADVANTLPMGNGGTDISSAADDTLLVSSGSAWQAKSVPNCTDTSGQHLNYTTSSNSFSCGTTATTFDPALSWNEYSDLNYLDGCITAVSSAGSVTFSGEVGHPGIAVITTSTSTATSNGFLKTAAPLTGTANIFVGGGTITYTTLIKIPTLWGGSDTGQMRIGLMDEISGAPSNGIHAQYESGQAKWMFYSRSAGSSSSATGGTDVGTGWTKLQIVVNSGGTSAELFINGVSQGTVSTNIPSAGMSWGAQVQKTAGTTAAILDVDMIQISQVFSSARY